jgi:hypothetical protein
MQGVRRFVEYRIRGQSVFRWEDVLPGEYRCEGECQAEKAPPKILFDEQGCMQFVNEDLSKVTGQFVEPNRVHAAPPGISTV